VGRWRSGRVWFGRSDLLFDAAADADGSLSKPAELAESMAVERAGARRERAPLSLVAGGQDQGMPWFSAIRKG